MNTMQETIDAVLGADGKLILARQPHLPPGPAEVTIRVAAPMGAKRTLADVSREIAADQRARGFPGWSAADLGTEEEATQNEDAWSEPGTQSKHSVAASLGASMSDHPNRHIRKAVDYALAHGWTLRKAGPRAHAWGRLYCPRQDREGCQHAAYSTPRVPEAHARDIIRAVDTCPHHPTGE